MSYINRELTRLKERAEDSVYPILANDEASDLDLITANDLCYYISELNKSNEKMKDKLTESFTKWGLSEKDIEICSKFHKYEEKYQQKLLNSSSFSKKLVGYATVLSNNMIIKNDNENNFIVSITNSSHKQAIDKKKKLDNRSERCKLNREAWLRKTYNETGLEDASEKVKFDRYYLEHMKRNKLR